MACKFGWWVGVALCFVTTVADADIYFDRKIEELNGASFRLDLNNGCSLKDQYGSNKCTFKWGDSLSGQVSGKLSKDLEKGSEIEVDLKIDRFIPFNVKCPVCGGQCKIHIPVVDKEIDIPLPPCPIAATDISTEPFNFDIPAEAPVDATVAVSGEITLRDQTGAHVAKVHIDAKISESNFMQTYLK
mmetsp:Transcript_1964/g.2525  ORF Transcript_1964/g.2525 Transcript_1964/m.2525 type:complete len:187 (-) Transcript_1964:12-572(-)|eukprot:CAMPEP_0204827384 /NCGR_PEP_ID=MMETSP1346-20131115/4858_1 /ASSEMBLY_ACC=CAM_ASM_000771 /TAXON_ID=215587 /ORGANISM="Aplanochytrium stocchinoi, Strain GSBS06" /LENGTH=186 /DNA_ID=CAMNT_0051955791 /DNA_START=91 /DNA_END=651 /DNA_ORIENTATION=-